MFGRKQLLLDIAERDEEIRKLEANSDDLFERLEAKRTLLDTERAQAHESKSNQREEWEKVVKDLEQAHTEAMEGFRQGKAQQLSELEDQHTIKMQAQKRLNEDDVASLISTFNEETSSLRQEVTHRAGQNEAYRWDLKTLNEKYMELKHQARWVYCFNSDTFTNPYFNLVASQSARSKKWDLLDDRDGETVAKSVDYAVVLMICDARGKDRYFGTDVD